MPANRFMIVFILLGCLVYALIDSSADNLIYLIPVLAVIAAVISVFKAQINLWWYKRFPPRLSKQIEALLRDFFPYYNQLNSAEQERFGVRINIFKIDKEFITPEMPEVPDDIRHLMVASAIQVSFGRKDFLLSHWGVVVVYRNPFRSIQIQEYHIGETYIEDGVIMLATDPFIKGLSKPQKGYGIGLHYMAKALQYEAKITNSQFLFFNEENEEEREKFLKTMCSIRQREKVYEDAYAPLKSEDFFGLCVEHFFNASARFEELMPDTYEALKKVLNQDPQKPEDPVIIKEAIEDL